MTKSFKVFSMAICLVMLPKSVLYDNSYNVCCNKYVKVMQSDKSKYTYAKKSDIVPSWTKKCAV